MPLLCPQLTADELTQVNKFILTRVPHNKTNPHPLFDDIMTGQVMIDAASDPAVLVFLSRRGLFFERRRGGTDESITTAIQRMFETTEQAGLVTPFVVDADDPTVVDKLLTRFQESYGQPLARTIDHHVYMYDGKKLMLVKFSPSVLRFTMAPSGGTLKTMYKGDPEALKQLPTLVKFVSTDTEAATGAVFATQYGEGSLPIVQRIHYDIMREVIARPNLGVCIGPIAVWDSA
jgi:hypothetical protein